MDPDDAGVKRPVRSTVGVKTGRLASVNVPVSVDDVRAVRDHSDQALRSWVAISDFLLTYSPSSREGRRRS